MSDLLQLDTRKRLSLGRYTKETRFTVDVDPAGVITLTPARVINSAEEALLRNPAVLDLIREQMTNYGGQGQEIPDLLED
jgi:hypothetical protein